MGKRGITIIKGIEVNDIINMLNKAFADEWLAYYQYYVEAKVVKGAMKDAAIAELNQHAADELRHAGMVADRIVQLGGTPVLHPNDWTKIANCAYAAPEDPEVMAILQQAIEGERCAIGVYSNIIETTANKDIVTYNIASSILADEVEHEDDLQALWEDIEEMVNKYKK